MAVAPRRRRRAKPSRFSQEAIRTIEGPFAPQLIAMLESPAMRVLSLSARRVLDRIEVELYRHGGKENGLLPVTFDDFEKFGIDRHAIAAALRETEALGLIEVTQRGTAGNAEFRRPSLYRLTYRNTDTAAPTHEWKRIGTRDQAKIVAKQARAEAPGKTKLQWGKTPRFSGGNPHRKGAVSVGETHTESPVGETHTTIDISMGGGDSTGTPTGD